MFDHYEFMGWGGVMGLLWIVLIVVLLLFLVGQFRGGRNDGDVPSAREILDRRYARGEIDREEYQQRLRDLEQ